MEVVHHTVDGVHHPAGMLPKLAAPLHLFWIVQVLELAEVLFGRWEVDEEPKEANKFKITYLGFIISFWKDKDKVKFHVLVTVKRTDAINSDQSPVFFFPL